jgi:large subunit ribosomal protein L17
MRHLKKRKLKIGYDASRRLKKSLCAALILHEKITITLSRARLIKAEVEKLITLGKEPSLHNKRQLFAALPKNAARKVFEVLGPKYLQRPGGYLRITKVGKFKDGTIKAQLEFV